jgi:hypothetical protein
MVLVYREIYKYSKESIKAATTATQKFYSSSTKGTKAAITVAGILQCHFVKVNIV